MAQRSTKVYSADYTELKKQLDAELNRRGKSEGTRQGQSVGSMAAYINSFSVTPAAGRQIANEHIQKITQPISAITGSTITPENGSTLHYGLLFSLLQLYRFMYGRLYRLVYKKLCQ